MLSVDSVADQLRPRVPKLATLMDDAEAEVPVGAIFLEQNDEWAIQHLLHEP